MKSLRAGHVSLAGAFVQEHDGELMLHGLHIAEHASGRYGTRSLYQPRRTRKLLLHRSEIDKIIGRLGDTGVTVVALSLYFQDGWAKAEIALARGRRSFDKRQVIAQRDADREIARELSDRVRGRRRRTRGSGSSVWARTAPSLRICWATCGPRNGPLSIHWCSPILARKWRT